MKEFKNTGLCSGYRKSVLSASLLLLVAGCANIEDTRDGKSILAKTPASSILLLNDSADIGEYEKTGQKFREDDPEWIGGYAYCESAISLAERGDFQAAINQALKALYIGKTGDKRLHAYAARNLAYIYDLAGNFRLAGEWVERTAEILTPLSLSDQDLKRVKGPIHKIRGDIALHEHRYKDAVAHYGNAVKESTPLFRPVSNAGLARALTEDKQPQKAREALQLARGDAPTLGRYFDYLEGYIEISGGNLQKAEELFRKALIADSGSDGAYHRVWAHAGLARIQGALNKPAQALKHYSDALLEIEAARPRFRSQEFKTSLFRNFQSVYEEALDFAWKNRQFETALAISQKARARAFLDIVRERAGNEAAGRPLERFDMFRQQLPSNLAVIVYHLTDKAGYAWVIRRNGITPVPINLTKDAAVSQVGRLRDFTSDPHVKNEDRNRSGLHAAKSLFDTLVRPLNLGSGEEISIVPHGELYNLPFQALYDGKARLIESHAISYIPALTEASARNSKASLDTGDRSFVIANPDAGEGLPFLEWINFEVKQIQPYLKNLLPLKMDKEATREAFFENAPRASLIHISSHAKWNENDPLYSAILLSPSNGHNGALAAWEFYNLNLRETDLIVLSNCQTSRTKVESGNEFYGFQRSLLATGTKAAVLPLWKIDDKATAFLLIEFYKNRASGKSDPESLRQAMITFIKSGEREHPYLWAAFNIVKR